MLRQLAVRCLAFAALLSIASSCGVIEPDERNELTLHVAPTLADCVGVGPQQCFMVKEHPGQEWTILYGDIAGFAYEPGYFYTLLVERRHVPDPPMDGASTEYRLLRILARDPAQPS